jgi:hypothetical protein
MPEAAQQQASPGGAHAAIAQQLRRCVCDGAKVLRGAVRLVLLQCPAHTQVGNLGACTILGSRVTRYQAVAAILQWQ